MRKITKRVRDNMGKKPKRDKTIADQLGVSRGEVRRSLIELVRDGFVLQEADPDTGGHAWRRIK